jgi:hypothetical protein
VAYRRHNGGAPLARGVLEHPLRVCRDVADSKLCARHMVAAFVDLIRIRRRYASGRWPRS